MVQRYRKKPFTVEAVRWDGDNIGEIHDFVKRNCAVYDWKACQLIIVTLEGEAFANHGDYIVRGTQGEYSVCKPDTFRMIYEPVEQ